MSRDVVPERIDASAAGGTGRDVALPSSEAAIPAATAALVVCGAGDRAEGSAVTGAPDIGADRSSIGIPPIVAGVVADPIGNVTAPGVAAAVGWRASGIAGTAFAVAVAVAVAAAAAAEAAGSTAAVCAAGRAEYCQPAKAIATMPTPAAIAASHAFDPAGRDSAGSGA